MELDQLKIILKDELVGLREAADILGWDPRRVTTYRKRGSFPEPIVTLAMGPVWFRKQITEYRDGTDE